MIDFNEYLFPSASPVGTRGVKSRLFNADLIARDDEAADQLNIAVHPILWRCNHRHASKAEAVACATSALRCEAASDLAQALDVAVRSYFVVK